MQETLLDETIQSFWETVPPLWGNIRAHIHAYAGVTFHLTVEQFHVLRLVRRGARTVSALAEAKKISRPAISQAVEALVQHGLLARAQSTSDRRVMELTLTTAGDDLLDAIFVETRQWMKARLAGCSADELCNITTAMLSLKKMLDLPNPE